MKKFPFIFIGILAVTSSFAQANKSAGSSMSTPAPQMAAVEGTVLNPDAKYMAKVEGTLPNPYLNLMAHIEGTIPIPGVSQPVKAAPTYTKKLGENKGEAKQKK